MSKLVQEVERAVYQTEVVGSITGCLSPHVDMFFGKDTEPIPSTGVCDSQHVLSGTV